MRWSRRIWRYIGMASTIQRVLLPTNWDWGGLLTGCHSTAIISIPDEGSWALLRRTKELSGQRTTRNPLIFSRMPQVYLGNWTAAIETSWKARRKLRRPLRMSTYSGFRSNLGECSLGETKYVHFSCKTRLFFNLQKPSQSGKAIVHQDSFISNKWTDLRRTAESRRNKELISAFQHSTEPETKEPSSQIFYPFQFIYNYMSI